MENNLLLQMKDIAGEQNVRVNELMKLHTSFGIGGPADYFVTPVNAVQVKDLIALLTRQNVSFYIIGNGSNLLVSDEGYRGVVIQLGGRYSDWSILHDDCATAADKANLVYIRAQAGMSMAKLGKVAADNSLTGAEFAGGIPGTVGGAVVMNAGAYGSEIKDIIVSATVLNPAGEMLTLSRDALELGYRSSIVAREGYIVLDALFALQAGNGQEIRKKAAELMARRIAKQPLEFPSAGSTFKRPKGYFAGGLIEDAGLKGLSIGGAKVSEKHAGFVINTGEATAKDVIELTDKITESVFAYCGVRLELEVKKLGF